jgi:peptide subunit release factor 1 (eRF1)
VDIDEKLASEDQVLDAVREVMDAHLEREQRALFERFSAEHGTNGRAAAGLERVLASLAEKKVETLLVREAAEAPGTKCVTCGWIGPAGPTRCPIDETSLDAVDNIVEPAIQAAIQQSAAVHVVRPANGEEPETPFSEPIAALLRY